MAHSFERVSSTDRLMADTSLELLARRLRMLGFDVAGAGSAGLEQVFEAARRERRIVLKLSARHPRRFADVPAFTVSRDCRVAVRAVAERYRPSGPPFSRCSICNGTLETRAASTAGDEVPEAVRRSAETLDHCSGCGRWYWAGTHVRRMRAWLESALGRAVEKRAPGSLGGREPGC
jgi:hypothetical protein